MSTDLSMNDSPIDFVKFMETGHRQNFQKLSCPRICF